LACSKPRLKSSGYYDYDTKDRIEMLFECEHPIFGKKKLSPPELFNLGFEHAKLFQLRN